VRTRQEVTAIQRDRKTVTVKQAETGESYEERYDALILATGSRPLVPPIAGADGPQNLVQTIKRNFGISIDNYVEVDFQYTYR